ncbi:AMP-binding protein [Microbacterium hominis]|uniref:AMP-binding protein n=1 Tax=Microbacterium hominis TaxID=162426 RepID=A0A7D4UFY3_9MICO|nr:AMP-binding protein [Microbacterium hominis]QKJ18929.1 AMP-binding protein [Microbacterium hominis]
MTTLNDRAIQGDGFATLNVATILAESAARYPSAPAVHFAGHTITYSSLWEQTRAYAGALKARGIGTGDRVALMAPNVPDFMRVYYAALALGAIVVPVHPLFKKNEIAFVLSDAQADLFVAAAPFLAEALPAAAAAKVPTVSVLVPDEMVAASGVPRLEEEAAAAAPIADIARTNPLDAATILYTSGTTGTPKGAVSSHFSIVEQVHTSLIDSLDMQRDDVVFGGLPLFHTFGQTAVMNTVFRRGASIALMPRFEADAALQLLVDQGVTIFAAVPTMFIDLIQAGARSDAQPALRYGISGGAALPRVILEKFAARFGAQVHEGYGLTETTPIVSFNTVHDDIRPGTVGTPLWGVDVAIAQADIDDSIQLTTDPEQIGEIVVRGHNVFKGYIGREDATDAAVVDGWFRTGDLGTITDRVVTIVDRKKDLIVRNGYNVYPTEVEQAVAAHPQLVAVSVFGLPDERRGEEVNAAVVVKSGEEVTAEDVIAFARERLAEYKYPRVVHIVDELPLGASGKVLRRALVERFGTPVEAGATV